MHYEERSSITLLSGGKKIFGILHLPKTVQKCPVVLFCHGFGGNKSSRWRFSVLLSEALSKQGIASLRFDFRGSGDSEGSLEEITPQKQLEDIVVCTDYLFSHPNIDKDRFGIIGRSFGGAIATAAAATIKNTKSLALLSPFFDAATWLADKTKTPSKGIFSVEKSTISFGGVPLSKECIDQITHLDIEAKLKNIHHIPLLLVYGLKDKSLGISHFENYKKARPDAETVVLQESDHEFSSHEERARAIDHIFSWFIRTL
jgi:pimeloyl-ACP methyl ester carboxylesterase